MVWTAINISGQIFKYGSHVLIIYTKSLATSPVLRTWAGFWKPCSLRSPYWCTWHIPFPLRSICPEPPFRLASPPPTHRWDIGHRQLFNCWKHKRDQNINIHKQAIIASPGERIDSRKQVATLPTTGIAVFAAPWWPPPTQVLGKRLSIPPSARLGWRQFPQTYLPTSSKGRSRSKPSSTPSLQPLLERHASPLARSEQHTLAGSSNWQVALALVQTLVLLQWSWWIGRY